MCALLTIRTAKILFGLCGVSSPAHASWAQLPPLLLCQPRLHGDRLVEEKYGLTAIGDKDSHQLVAYGELRAAKGKEKQNY